jgi:hypothetical protein
MVNVAEIAVQERDKSSWYSGLVAGLREMGVMAVVVIVIEVVELESNYDVGDRRARYGLLKAGLWLALKVHCKLQAMSVAPAHNDYPKSGARK